MQFGSFQLPLLRISVLDRGFIEARSKSNTISEKGYVCFSHGKTLVTCNGISRGPGYSSRFYVCDLHSCFCMIQGHLLLHFGEKGDASTDHTLLHAS